MNSLVASISLVQAGLETVVRIVRTGVAVMGVCALLLTGCASNDGDDRSEDEEQTETFDPPTDDNDASPDDDYNDDEMPVGDPNEEGPFPAAVDCDEFVPAELPSGEDSDEGSELDDPGFGLQIGYGEDMDRVTVAWGQQVVGEEVGDTDEWLDGEFSPAVIEVDGTERHIVPVGDGPTLRSKYVLSRMNAPTCFGCPAPIRKATTRDTTSNPPPNTPSASNVSPEFAPAFRSERWR